MVGAVVLGQAMFRVSILYDPVSEAAARLSMPPITRVVVVETDGVRQTGDE